jgi:hypothetical protein
MADEPITVTPPTCAECGQPWLDPAERWRSFLDDEDEPRLYCPEHAEAEFGSS